MVALRTPSAEGTLSVWVGEGEGGGEEIWLDRGMEFETIVGRSRRLKAFATSESHFESVTEWCGMLAMPRLVIMP